MPPLPPPSQPKPRIILYQQTHHHANQPISLLPLLTAQHPQPPSVTHLILAAVHLNESTSPTPLNLNDHPPTHPRFTQLWAEVRQLQAAGVKVMCMLGGAARGSFTRLDYQPSELASLPALNQICSESDSNDNNSVPRLRTPAHFEQYYPLLRNFIRQHALDGVDLDVEEPTSLPGIIHLIDRLRDDFGPSSGFSITLAPVATALIRGMRHLSGFDYFELERLRGRRGVDWYHAQFYNGWGSLEGGEWYDHIVGQQGWKAEKVVVGLLTNPRHGGSGYVEWDCVDRVLSGLVEKHPRFGGVMGWEYWEAVPELDMVATGRAAAGEGRGEAKDGDETHYWVWAWRMGWIFALKEIRDRAVVVAAGKSLAGSSIPGSE